MTNAEREAATATALVAAAKAGDPRAFDALVKRYRKRIYALALHITGSAHEADDITHAEDPAGESFGVKRFELVDLLAHPREFDGLIGDFAEREGGSTAGVAVEFCQDDSGEAEGVMKMFSGADGLLAGGRVADKEDLLRSQSVLQLP